MSKDIYSKYVSFLREHELFDKKIFNYFQENSVIVNYRHIDDFSSIGCSIVLDKNGRLIQIIPCVPFLKNDKMAAINIFVYVQTLRLIPNIGRKYDERYYDLTLPLVFQKLYILENKCNNLLNYEKEMMKKVFREKKLELDNAIQYEDSLINSYYDDKGKLNNSARKIKRKARNYLIDKNI